MSLQLIYTERWSIVANKSSGKPQKTNFVDISSSSQVTRVYKKKGRVLRIVSVVLSVLMLFSGMVLIYYYSVLDSLNFDDFNSDKNETKPVSIEGTTTPPELILNGNTIGNGELLSNPKVLNIMIFGQDSASGGTEKYGRSDTMILASIDKKSKKIKLTSFMRDTVVTIPGYYDAKLNASYSLGGAELAIQTIEANFGVKIDRYVIIDFKSFRSIINVLGGIDIELTQDEIDYINFQSYINNQTDTRNEITSPAGVVHLNGRQALWYARNRGYQDSEHPEFVVAGDDHDRTARQRNLINNIFSSFKSASLPQIVQIVGEIGPLMTTNFKKEEITLLVSGALNYLKYDIEELSATPLDKLGAFWKYSRYESLGSVIEITDWDTCRGEIAQFIYGDLLSGSVADTTAA